MKNKIVKFGLIKEGENWRAIENANIFTDDDVEVLNFTTEKAREKYCNEHNITLIKENEKIN
jgi:hypothetical protein